jgi:hypothetical protein
MSRADLGHQSSCRRRMSHWQSVLTSSAFGTRSNSVGSITWPAQWHTADHYHRVRHGKMATDHHQSTCHRAVAARARRRPRPLRINQTAPNTQGAEAVAIAHPSATSDPRRTDAFGAGTGEKVGRSAQFDATICAPKRHNFSASARQKHEERGKVGIVLVDPSGSVPRTTILTSCQSRRALARRPSRLRAAPTARRHGGCTSLPPNHTSVAAATIPF